MNNQPTQSILGRLRSVTPVRADLSFDEALRVAELQATRFAELVGGSDRLREATIDGLPRIRVVHEPIAVSGMSHWTGVEWLITLNEADSLRRQRFTLLHEFKHIIDHGVTHRLYTGSLRADAALQAERAADFFAGCALVPKRELKSAWGQGIQRIAVLAEHFDVSEEAIIVRLSQTKLNQAVDKVPAPRCARPVSSPRGVGQRFRVAHRSLRRSYS
jgi:hypothetical protein